nr:MAG TPA: hypothetical protein [Caudoviricetes sp.]
MENFNTNGTVNTNNVNNTINMEEVSKKIKHFLNNTELDVDDTWGQVVGVDDFDNTWGKVIGVDTTSAPWFDELLNETFKTMKMKNLLQEMELQYPDDYVNGSDIIYFVYSEHHNYLLASIYPNDGVTDSGYIYYKRLQNCEVTEQVYDFLCNLLSDRNILINGRSEIVHVCVQSVPYTPVDIFDGLDGLKGLCTKKTRPKKTEGVKYEDVVTALRLIRDSNPTEMILDVRE